MTRRRPDHRSLRRGRAALLVGLIGFAVLLVPAPPGYARDKVDEDTFGKPDVVLALIKPLKEVSGLAVSATGDLIAHNDELAKTWHISVVDGAIMKSLEFKHVGRSFLGDFEGVARVGEATWMINSRGYLFRTIPGEDFVAVYDTRLGRKCEVEGLAWWRQRNALLIACKRTSGKKLKGKAVLFTWSLETHTPERGRITIDLKELKKIHDLKTFRPSGVAVRDDGSELLVLSSKARAIAVLSAEGDLLRVHKLNKTYHPQPEGIAILADGTLVIADEGENGPGTLSLYHTGETR